MEAGDEIQATSDAELYMEYESLLIHDDLTITATSSVKLLRDACRWLGDLSLVQRRECLTDARKPRKQL
jgi:hypothetical protein